MAEKDQIKPITKIIIAYLYFVQGLALAFCSTIPLTYKQIPNYQILGYFSAAALPFSFKFITAPLIEKYSILTYGRRKFWLVLAMGLACLFFFAVSKTVQDPSKQIQTAGLLGIVILCLSIQDISLDALAIKQLRKPELGSLLQSIFQQIGIVIGSLMMGELTSAKFGAYLGYQTQIFTPSDIILAILPFLLIPTLLIHLNFKQKYAEKEGIVSKLSLMQVISHYKLFILPRYRVCRQAILFLVMFFGTNFFVAGYTIELIKSEILSKQFIISLGNLSLIIIFPSTYILSRYVNRSNIQKFQGVIFVLRAVLYSGVFFIDSKSSSLATISLFLMMLISSLHFYLHGIIMSSFEDSKFEGMSVTMMASMSNLGRNSTLQLKIIGNYGFQTCCYYSFFYSSGVCILLQGFYKWINKGTQQEIIESDELKTKENIQVHVE